MPARPTSVHALITAEHASRAVPDDWQDVLPLTDPMLDSHRAWDPGTAAFAEGLAERLGAPLLEGRVSRLLVDLNRSEGHPALFSDYTRGLDAERKQMLLHRYHRPHWRAFREAIEARARCRHLACHSFAPVLNGRVRSTDVALLFDPRRPAEARWSRDLILRLRQAFPDWRVHANQPYRGTSNGLGQQHRFMFTEDRLLTVELEINQARIAGEAWPEQQARMVEILADSMR
ncbi:N-formylglutamate amidohydrolase [Wenzhouxiangella marina]|uniref:N-formylglutamate amidohydrolase n=1 Tax=Wenzhouxiangella marina TaxID=1579979 RepID=UPI0009E1F170|nr:N-formylglutamate amidohydrolase [Wenzhouxiangella marina]MBB6086349.1 putative N-formylglutamate amidohydrolase [Wenzhouxiangella marina]